MFFQVLELQGRLQVKDAKLAELAAQLQAAQSQPAPGGGRTSLADISNRAAVQQAQAPGQKAAEQVCFHTASAVLPPSSQHGTCAIHVQLMHAALEADQGRRLPLQVPALEARLADAAAQLAAERAGRQRLSGCLAALAADLQARDERFSRLAACATAPAAAGATEGAASVAGAATSAANDLPPTGPAGSALADGSLPLLGRAAAALLAEVRLQAAALLASQAQCAETEAQSSWRADQGGAASVAAASEQSSAAEAGQPAVILHRAGGDDAGGESVGDSVAASNACDGPGAAGQTAAGDAVPDTGRSRCGQGDAGGPQAEHLKSVRRLCKQFDEQVVFQGHSRGTLLRL